MSNQTEKTKDGTPSDGTQSDGTRSDSTQSDRFPSLSIILPVLLMGIYFGIVLTKAEVVRWERVHKMFLFQEAHMYLIICTGIVVSMISMLILKQTRAKSIQGEPIVYKPKRYHLGVVIGGAIFGAGWAITGACPGPIYAQIGGGAYMAFFTLVGALIGMFIYATLKPKLPH